MNVNLLNLVQLYPMPFNLVRRKFFVSLRQVLANAQYQRDLTFLEKAKQKVSDMLLGPIEQNMNFVTISAEELFQQLNGSKLTEPGQIATGYETKAIVGSLEAVFGATLETGVGGFDAEIAAVVSGNKVDYKLHVLQYQPKKFFLPVVRTVGGRMPAQIFPKGSDDGTSDQFFRTADHTRPYFLGMLAGMEKQIEISVGSKVAVTVYQPDLSGMQATLFPESATAPADENADEAGDELGFGVELSLEAGASYKGNMMYLEDVQPSFYSTIDDPGYALELQANIGVGNRNDSLKKIATWLKETYSADLLMLPPPQQRDQVDQQQVDALQEILATTKSAMDTWVYYSNKKIIDALGLAYTYEEMKYWTGIASLNNALTARAEKNISIIDNSKILVGLNIAEQFVTGNRYTSPAIVEKLKALGYQDCGSNTLSAGFYQSGTNQITVGCYSRVLPPAQDAEKPLSIFKINFTGEALDYLALDLVSDAGIAPANPGINKLVLLPAPVFMARIYGGIQPGQLVSFLSYSGHQPAAAAALNATIKEKGITAEASAVAKFGKYRFQTAGSVSNLNIYLTQDVQITYKQVAMSGKILNISREKEFRNSVSYYGAICNWAPSAKSDLTSQTGYALKGSGIAFGTSLSVTSVVRWPTASPNFKQKLAATLYTDIATLDTFFTELLKGYKKETESGQQPLPEADPESYEFEAEHILVESSFRLNNLAVTYYRKTNKDVVNYKLDKTLRDTWLAYFKNQANNQPNGSLQEPFTAAALRARVRVGDMIENSIGCFKLKIPPGAVPLEFNLEVGVTSSAGTFGVLDLYTYILPGIDVNDVPAPVALFFQ